MPWCQDTHINSNHVSIRLDRLREETNIQKHRTVDQENIDTTIKPKNKDSRLGEIQEDAKLGKISEINEPNWPKYDVNIICVMIYYAMIFDG